MEGVGVLREQTKRFIDENPTDVIFTHNEQTPDGMGGHTSTPDPVPAQTVRIIQVVSAQATERRTVSGEMVTPDLKVLAEWDADIKKDDTFEWEGLRLEVVWVVLLPYEKTAEVAVV